MWIIFVTLYVIAVGIYSDLMNTFTGTWQYWIAILKIILYIYIGFSTFINWKILESVVSLFS